MKINSTCIVALISLFLVAGCTPFKTTDKQQPTLRDAKNYCKNSNMEYEYSTVDVDIHILCNNK